MLPAFTITVLFIAVAYRPAPPKDKLEWLTLQEAQEKFQKEKSLINNEEAFVFLMWTIILILNQKHHQH